MSYVTTRFKVNIIKYKLYNSKFQPGIRYYVMIGYISRSALCKIGQFMHFCGTVMKLST